MYVLCLRPPIAFGAWFQRVNKNEVELCSENKIEELSQDSKLDKTNKYTTYKLQVIWNMGKACDNIYISFHACPSPKMQSWGLKCRVKGLSWYLLWWWDCVDIRYTEDGFWHTGRHVTVYHMIWATECTHCVIWYGFSKFIESVNNIGST